MRNLICHCLISGFILTNIAAARQDSVTSGYIDVNDGKLYYEQAGSGEETIIFIHDGLVHSVIWDNQFTTFAEKYKVIRYDRRGYGRSPKPEKKYSNIDDLYRVFTFLNIDKAILIGMSSGGGLVLDFTIAHPEKVSKIILVGAVVGGFTYSEHFQTRGGRLTPVDYSNPQKLLKYFVTEDPYEIALQNKDKKEKLWTLMQKFPQNIDPGRNRLAIIPENKAVDMLDQIKIPALIVAGEFDIPDVFVHAGAIEYALPNAQKVIISNAGHLAPYEQPESFNEQVINFLNRTQFFGVLNEEGVTAAVELFKQKRKENKEWLPFRESGMNKLGYQYLQSGKTKEAIELFKLNTLAYPESSNTYDSLGEAYMVNGNKERAIENYKKSLQLNPENTNAREKLEQLK
ncbi:MAG: alpha/beta fold hydrolase [Calditrichaceae bacterium]